MKKLLLSAAIAAFALTSVNAQEVKFGAKAGLNLATISGDETDGVKSITSFHVGGVAEISISEKFAVQPEIMYSAQGAKMEEFGFTYTENYGYINIPVMAKYMVAEGLSLEAGPQIGVLISAKAKLEGNGMSEEEDIKEFMESLDYGVNFGLGYKLESGLNFAARYNLGLANIYKDSGDFTNTNSVIQISVGFMF